MPKSAPAPSLFAAPEPLAARLRPRTLEEFVGQEHLLAPGKPLGDAIRRGDVGSTIFWGPPGSGKTTLAGIIAHYTDREFVAFSAVTEGVPRVREIIKEAEQRRTISGRGTILFCDEIHRFNRAQQDAFLPHVENGVITLIGATTENPSFELTSALLSRCRVFVLEPLATEHILALMQRALSDNDRGLGGLKLEAAPGALEMLAEHADGDARRALAVIEAAGQQVGPGGRLTSELLTDVLARRVPLYDKSGEGHFNLISALHKAVRGSDPQGSLYWLARMIEGGEDPLYITRRVVRMAVEDIGLADPQALSITLAAKDAYHFLGSPEGELAIAEAVVYLATAPKSNRVYLGYGEAMAAARESPAAPVPLHIRNAPTGLMKELGYGKGYRYAHDYDDAYVPQEYLPEEMKGKIFYQPGEMGFEKKVKERLEYWEKLRRESSDK
jgi:putative ATPase